MQDATISGEPSLATLLQQRRDPILRAWERKLLERVPVAAQLTRSRRIDFVPQLLERMAHIFVEASAGGTPDLEIEEAKQHARKRLEDGFQLSDVLRELTLLRDCILRFHEPGSNARRSEHRILQRIFDAVSVSAAEGYGKARNRLLTALERISVAALKTKSHDKLLDELLSVFHEESLGVDMCAILLREEDRLVLYAARGLDAEQDCGFSLAVGEGFSGLIAAEKREIELSDSGIRPLRRGWLRKRQIRGMLGVPLMEEGEVIGVALMASTTTESFSQQDKLLFRAMAGRAAAALGLHMLREAAAAKARQVAESEALFRATFDLAGAGIALVGLDGKWLRVNPRYREMLGYSEEELQQLSYHELTHPDDRETEAREAQRLLNGEVESIAFEKRHLTKHGVAWISTTASLLRDERGEPLHFVTVAHDVTAKRILQDRLAFLAEGGALLGSSLNYRETLDRVAQLAVPMIADWCAVDVIPPNGGLHSHEAVVHRDPHKLSLVHELRRRYPPAEDPFGIGKVIATGEPELIEDVDEGLLNELVADPEQRQMIEQLGVHSAMIVPLVRGDHILGAITLAYAESQRRFRADDLWFARELARHAAAAIENARLHSQTRRSVELRDRILAIVSHDLRNPVSSIGLAATVLVHHPELRDHPAVKKHVELIRRSTRSMLRLLGDLLDMSSIEAGRLSLELQQTDLHALLLETVEVHVPLARAASIELDHRLAVHGVTLECDRDRISQLLSNLLGNALKFCEPGDKITVCAEADPRHVVIRVTDTGPGIPSQDLPHIFDVYWQRKGQSGAGLGLFISKDIVEAHGGTLTVHSEPEAGTTFEIRLPRSPRRRHRRADGRGG